jgi:hypothetical protein
MTNDVVRWDEVRTFYDFPSDYKELFRISAERIDGSWTFYEKGVDDIRFFPIPATLELVARANKEITNSLNSRLVGVL